LPVPVLGLAGTRDDRSPTTQPIFGHQRADILDRVASFFPLGGLNLLIEGFLLSEQILQ
jgi:hypothetical protein